jgi:hypothetical protein
MILGQADYLFTRQPCEQDHESKSGVHEKREVSIERL